MSTIAQYRGMEYVGLSTKVVALAMCVAGGKLLFKKNFRRLTVADIFAIFFHQTQVPGLAAGINRFPENMPSEHRSRAS